MNTFLLRKTGPLLALATATLLGACGGSDYNDEQAAAEERRVPASANASTASWTQFVGDQGASDTLAPLDLSGAEPPVSETEEARVI